MLIGLVFLVGVLKRGDLDTFGRPCRLSRA
jgi:hypothetical protein